MVGPRAPRRWAPRRPAATSRPSDASAGASGVVSRRAGDSRRDRRACAACHSCGACGHQAPRWLGRCPELRRVGHRSVEEAAPGRARPPRASRIVAGASTRLRRSRRATDARALAHRHRRARPRARRRHRPGLARAGRRRARHRQVHAAAPGARRPVAGTGRVLLVCGEESPAQVRCAPSASSGDCGDVEVLAETGLETVAGRDRGRAARRCARSTRCRRSHSDALDGGAGQRRPGARGAGRAACALAKDSGVAVILVGHVTKDGALAGPRVLEHLVDCVLQFEGDDAARPPHAARHQEPLRLDQRDRHLRDAPGRPRVGGRPLAPSSWPRRASAGRLVRVPGRRGQPALLVEVQALVGPDRARPAASRGRRLRPHPPGQVVAVLGRHAGLRLGDRTCSLALPAGRALDPAADLAIALAVASAHRGVPLAAGTVAFGEIGLTGGVRPVGHGANGVSPRPAAQRLDAWRHPRMARARDARCRRWPELVGVAAIPRGARGRLRADRGVSTATTSGGCAVYRSETRSSTRTMVPARS